jgi:hypothetical protein
LGFRQARPDGLVAGNRSLPANVLLPRWWGRNGHAIRYWRPSGPEAGSDGLFDGQPGTRLVLRPRRRKALATTTATRNVALGLVIVGSNFAGTPAVTAVVACGLVSILGALGLALLLGSLDAIGKERVRVASSR